MSNNQCAYCRKRPTSDHHPYCGRHCAVNAQRERELEDSNVRRSKRNCRFCEARTKYPGHDYCSKSCAMIACAPIALFPKNTIRKQSTDGVPFGGKTNTLRLDKRKTEQLPFPYDRSFRDHAKLDLKGAREGEEDEFIPADDSDECKSSGFDSDSSVAADLKYETCSELDSDLDDSEEAKVTDDYSDSDTGKYVQYPKAKACTKCSHVSPDAGRHRRTKHTVKTETASKWKCKKCGERVDLEARRVSTTCKHSALTKVDRSKPRACRHTSCRR